MKNLYRIHFLSLCIYLGGITGAVCIFIVAKKLFCIELPSQVLASTAVLCLIASATLRISVWKKRKTFLTPDELERCDVKIFISFAWFEIITAAVAAGIIIS